MVAVECFEMDLVGVTIDAAVFVDRFEVDPAGVTMEAADFGVRIDFADRAGVAIGEAMDLGEVLVIDCARPPALSFDSIFCSVTPLNVYSGKIA